MKKVWIASILATLIMMVPFTNVVSASEVHEDCVCQVSNVFRHLQTKMMLIKPKAVKNHLPLKENGKIIQLSLSNNNNKECFILQIKFNIATIKFIILLYMTIYLHPIFPSLAQKMEDLAFYYFKMSDEYLQTAIDLNCDWIYD